LLVVDLLPDVDLLADVDLLVDLLAVDLRLVVLRVAVFRPFELVVVALLPDFPAVTRSRWPPLLLDSVVAGGAVDCCAELA
jgi:hypothetical protein